MFNQRTFDQLAVIPSLQVVEERLFKVFSKDRVQQSVVEQNIVQSTKEQFLDVLLPLLKEQMCLGIQSC